jgi:hypothetical protein
MNKPLVLIMKDEFDLVLLHRERRLTTSLYPAFKLSQQFKMEVKLRHGSSGREPQPLSHTWERRPTLSLLSVCTPHAVKINLLHPLEKGD